MKMFRIIAAAPMMRRPKGIKNVRSIKYASCLLFSLLYYNIIGNYFNII